MCNCIAEVTKKLREHYDGKFKKPIESLQLQTYIDFNSGRLGTYTEVKIALVDQKKVETASLVHTFCPFCGVRLREKEA
ncbi:hypothetical protein SAMN04488503_2251 [Humidesulfovibrio mexicanus]|uniref:Uncharacterized protein n=1 Tax=Humidesulfovibrio mexicanus TaxID=147047 RepID=A0A239AXG1_9BACT|nr:hypothetical protein [Humidesulfovibrio mexicanus]SNR99668.1 hypothetical protein SAMN04488503_2251 [Humidesulfovibrio mexicanus]